MNFKNVFQLSTFILLEIYGTVIEAQYAKCKMIPCDVDKVDVTVYINGETSLDVIWYSRYCSWKSDGFDFDTYAPITVNVGAEITCDDNNKCKCPNEADSNADCAATFRNVCAEKILGQPEFLKLLCCSAVFRNDKSGERKGFQQCVDEQSDLAEKISACLENQGPGCPQETAIKNANDVAAAGVDVAKNNEPFFLYNWTFDKCISDDSPGWFLQKICLMLKYETAKDIDQCVRAMGWKHKKKKN